MRCKSVIVAILISLVASGFIVYYSEDEDLEMNLLKFLNKTYRLQIVDGNINDVIVNGGVDFLSFYQHEFLEEELELVNEGEEFVMRLSYANTQRHLKFTFGQEFDEYTVFGERVRSKITKMKNSLTHTQRGDFEIVTVREFTNDKVLTEVRINGRRILAVYAYKDN